jgi:methionyl aminopeptidase
MRLTSQEAFSTNGFVKLKNQDWLEKQRIAGRIAANALIHLQNQVENKTTQSLIELNESAEKLITDAGGFPTFKGYKGFPAGVCISVNKHLVHGIPTDYKLQDGDLISFDLGVTIEGAIADTAITCIYGQPKSEKHLALIKATEESLMKGIEAIEVGKHLGVIGNAIYRHAKGCGFGVITQYGGHGLDWDHPHASPFVENKSDINSGIRIQPGLAIAIEPMLVLGSTETKVLADGWTVATNDLGAHFEHSVFVHEDHVEIITDRHRSVMCGS